ncbi:MAG: hypothetical protein HY042_01715 [Spirochaetia bacterium]|nr:hypothetical protein [Spirochaetia bacterium]
MSEDLNTIWMFAQKIIEVGAGIVIVYYITVLFLFPIAEPLLIDWLWFRKAKLMMSHVRVRWGSAVDIVFNRIAPAGYLIGAVGILVLGFFGVLNDNVLVLMIGLLPGGGLVLHGIPGKVHALSYLAAAACFVFAAMAILVPGRKEMFDRFFNTSFRLGLIAWIASWIVYKALQVVK